MIAQSLKKSILQEAISGRLVPQIESEGTADDLLQQIVKEHREAFLAQQAKEKAEAEANGKKFTPKKYVPLTFSVISEDEQPFEIPNSWRWVRLGEFSKSVLYGVSESAKISGKYKLLRITDIQNNTVVWNTVPYTDFNDDKVIQYLLEKNDILFARTGGTVGKSYLVDKCPNNAIYASYLIRVRLFNCVFAKYIKSFFESPIYWSQIIDNLSGTGQPNCNGAKLANLLIPLPPLSEQRRIVTKLETLLPKIDSLEKTETRLSLLESTLGERLWKSVLQEAISGRLTTRQPSDGTADDLLEQIKAAHREAFATTQKKYKPLTFSPIPDSEIPFEIPENWRWVRLGEIFQHSAGKQLSSSNQQGRLHKYITTSNLYWNKFILDNLKEMYYRDEELERCTAKKGDLLVCEGGDVGRSAIWNYDFDICLQNHVHRLRPLVKGYTEYVYYVMFYLKRSNQIAGKGTAIQGLSANSLKNILIPLPPLSEQLRIVTKLEKLRSALDKRG